LNWDIVEEMSTVKELMLSPEGTVAAAALVAGAADVDDAAVVAGAVVVVEDDEQPAAIRAPTAATATQPSFLLPSSIRYPFRHNAFGYADAGHRTTRVSVRLER
jgi:hypothetical protein